MVESSKTEEKTIKFIREFKVAILGDEGVGKSTFISRFIPFIEKIQKENIDDTSDAASPYQETNVCINTTLGNIKIIFKDKKLNDDEQSDYLKGVDLVIIMFDVMSRITYKNTPTYYKLINENIGKILVGNKIDCKDRKVKPKNICFHRKKNINYFDICCKSNYNLDKVILSIIKTLLNDKNLAFAKTPEFEEPDKLEFEKFEYPTFIIDDDELEDL